MKKETEINMAFNIQRHEARTWFIHDEKEENKYVFLLVVCVAESGLVFHVDRQGKEREEKELG